ncbi:MAG: bifunctional diaminohydroxyphosphoribosylaminopyrimidine deaminase/5-amino-6-(5-phosphoribosylamino)uracil reductase RibD [Candidatus Omnitrophica bacterium]|nr:bifunctional diaminohydroxyphosphoribosylaminopyrimidine deaminase/5-amino-6-(5-phosphoribosylamino)uracil reductase RibD [Candidatus Omnitrophota bacterium]
MNNNTEIYLKRALQLAAKGRGLVSPNPLVGAVLVKNNRIIGEGYHQYFGGDHAEIDALKNSTESPEGSTLYVNLEPCSHFGKTPPCTKALIKNRIKKVVAAMADPNPSVSGKGFEEMRKAGIEVETGLLEQESREINRAYLTRLKKDRPFIALKIAQTLDGKIASYTGQSKWITGEKARAFGRRLRFEYDVILVGINTILSDNPSLNYPRTGIPQTLLSRKRYLKVILDSEARLPLPAKIWEEASRIVVAVAKKAPAGRLRCLEKKGAQIIVAGNQKIDLEKLLDFLYRQEIGSVLVEGGAATNGSFIDAGLVDLVYLFQAPLIIGGEKAKTSVAGKGFATPESALHLKLKSTRRFNADHLSIYINEENL